MPDMPGRTEFSADEEQQLRDQRRDAAYANLPMSRNVEDRQDNEPGEADLARARAAYVVGRKGMFRRA
jgi:hypothetical protein